MQEAAIPKRRVVEGVSLSWLVPGSTIDFDLYRKGDDAGFTVYKGRGDRLGEWDRRRLESIGVRRLYIDISDRIALDRYLSQNAPVFVEQNTFDLSQRSRYLYDSANRIMRNLLAYPDDKEYMQMAVEIAESTVDLFLGDPKAFHALVLCASHKYYTYSHSVDVMIYSIGLGQKMGFSRSHLKRLAGGALLHDIGKSKIPIEVIAKEGPLSEKEYALMKQHPLFGEEILRELGVNDSLMIDVVLHHHERLDGSGYPHGLKAGAISTEAQLVFVADVFAALSTHRSYQNAKKTFEALSIMKNEMAGQFDEKLLKPFILLMGRVGA
jgi:putative nucleotidyltransferase with HDIG domain